MKTRRLPALAISALIALSVNADETRINQYRSQLQTIRPAELARETARLITAAHADSADAVTAAVLINPASAPMVVGSVAKASPQSASSAASAAIVLQPRMSTAVTKAAVSAAPAEVSAIVAAMCKTRPTSFYSIGVAAGEAAPNAADKIIPAITAGVPALKPVIERALKDFKAANRTASLALVLKHTDNILAALSRSEKVSSETFLTDSTDSVVSAKLTALADSPPPPVQRPPFVPGGTPTEVPAGGTTEIPPTSRNYSAP